MLAKALLGAGKSAVPAFVEDVFSTYLYTGTGATQTITNGIDLSGKGGLTWIKGRSGVTDHALYDTVRGATFDLVSNSAAAQTTQSTGLTAFSSTGFSIGALAKLNTNAATYASWTFREQPKFFDIVTYTGNNSSQTISHNLGSVPGCILVKCLDADSWFVYHRSLGASQYLNLSLTAAASSSSGFWGSVTSTTFGISTAISANSTQYVAYLFAHNAGGFGLTGTDNVISCGSFTTDASANATVTLGYEPQWLLVKRSSSTGGNWFMLDVMRGWTSNGANADNLLLANTSGAEDTASYAWGNPTATGFSVGADQINSTYIYIAIRRGPMKTPTSGTSVFATTSFTGVDSLQTSGFPVDFVFEGENIAATTSWYWQDRLRGSRYLRSNTTAAESIQTGFILDNNTKVRVSDSGNNYKRSYEMFGRAPGFFDVVCYTGTGVARTVAHNLTVAPELMIIKNRTTAGTEWAVYAAPQGATKFAYLNDTIAFAASSVMWNDTSPTSSVFTVGTVTRVNGSGNSLVAYLFATLAGISKVGSYTGNGSSQTIACGFTAGARFVMIKRTDSTGDWYVWDTARGIVSGNDPHLSLNTTAAEVTTDDTIDPDNSGFIVNQVAATNVNVNAATYIFLAIA